MGNKKLHPIEKTMKSEALCAPELGSDFLSLSPERGGRGDGAQIPQVADPPDPEFHSQIQQQVCKWGGPMR
jgi:hypothetical protein